MFIFFLFFCGVGGLVIFIGESLGKLYFSGKLGFIWGREIIFEKRVLEI